jgi:hypothetical protein
MYVSVLKKLDQKIHCGHMIPHYVTSMGVLDHSCVTLLDEIGFD